MAITAGELHYPGKSEAMNVIATTTACSDAEHSEEVARFTKWFDDYNKEIFRYAKFHVGNEAAADDIVQEVFLRAWTYRESQKRPEAARAWLYKIAANVIADSQRKSYRVDFTLLQKLADALRTWLAPQDSDPIRDMLDEAVSQLSPTMRKVMVLHLTGLTDAEIAEAMGADEVVDADEVAGADETMGADEVSKKSNARIRMQRMRARHELKKSLREQR
jgi:RNA polymerase sigma-70 factor (ECF subfamily)